MEVSRNYFAIDSATGDAYYFGEEVDNYKNGKISDHEGSWLAGVNGARFGLTIAGRPKLGDRYYQEYAPKIAMDRAEIVTLSERVQTPAGSFTDVVLSRETSALERGSESKWYAPGVGLVRDGSFKLVGIDKP